MSEMVEKVAEALMRARHPDAPLTYAEVVYAVELGSDPATLEGFRRDARAAISAMSEASDEFLETVDFHSGEHSRSGETYPVLRNFLRAFVAASLSPEGRRE
jgi:hypothetical protein